jgi:hypothetical protein
MLGESATPARPFGESETGTRGKTGIVPTRGVGPHLASLAVLSACFLVTLLAFGSGARGATTLQRLNLVSVTSEEQFVNNADDRQRGFGDNPFGNFKAAAATTREHNNGPFPGDQALFQFRLYSGADLKRILGTAIFTCTYNFDRQGFCDASWILKGGTLIGTGPVDFGAKSFQLVITGGTGKYRGVSGNVVSTPTAGYGTVRLAMTIH